MKKIILIAVLALLPAAVKGQLDVTFVKTTDIVTFDKDEVEYKFDVKAPKDTANNGVVVTCSIKDSDFNASEYECTFNGTNSLTISNGAAADATFTVKFKRKLGVNKFLKFDFDAVDANKKPVSIKAHTPLMLYLKGSTAEPIKTNDNYEFWFFTGTNVDFLDGAKVKDLYFKGSYMVNFKLNNEPSRSWLYTTFGKNRFFTDKDSLTNIILRDAVPTATPGDTITLVNGYYKSVRQKVTDNIFVSADYLLYLKEISSKQSRLFATAGLYCGLQSIKTSYSNYAIVTDTLNVPRNADSTYVFRTFLKNYKIRQTNYNFRIGLMHILTTDKINVKTHATVGLNSFTYPSSIVSTSTDEFVRYKNDKRFFSQINIDATVLNPGISLGFETFLREGEMPLFNVSLTKVIDIEQLSSLFGKVPTINN